MEKVKPAQIIGAVMVLVIVALVGGWIWRSYHKTAEKTAGTNKPLIHTSTIVKASWSEPLETGFGSIGRTITFQTESENIEYLVQYLGTPLGTVEETIPPRRNRGSWKSKYPNISASHAKFKLAHNNKTDSAILQYMYGRE